jgi:hypothetical protein
MHDYLSEIRIAGPLLLWSLVVLGLLVAARELGAFLRRRIESRGTYERAETEQGYMLSAMLGLLALLVAFTFSVALNRYETRRALVVTEANAIGTFILRTDLFADPRPVRASLRAYVGRRLEDGWLDRSDPAQEARENAAQRQLWQATIRALADDRRTPLVANLLGPLNAAFYTAAARKAERAARLPGRVMVTLLLYTLAASLVMGYAIGDRRLRALSYMLFALLILSVGLILDLDLPQTGSILVSQAPMEEVFATLGG